MLLWSFEMEIQLNFIKCKKVILIKEYEKEVPRSEQIPLCKLRHLQHKHKEWISKARVLFLQTREK